MNRFQTQESLVADFIYGLNNAGMQPSSGIDKIKPRYYRGYVTSEHIDESIFLRYNIDMNETAHYADNDDFMRSIQIGCEIYTSNGYGDEDYQNLCVDIENNLKAKGFTIEWGNEETDASFDIDNPKSMKRFTVEKNKI